MIHHSIVDVPKQVLPDTLPPLSIRGVTDLAVWQSAAENTRFPQNGVFASIDWLRYSVSWPGDEIPEVGRSAILRDAFHPSEKLFLTGERLPVPKGYDTCWALSHGSIRYHSERPGQKIGVEFTGRSLSDLRGADVQAVDLLKYAVSVGARVTRLDLALDVFGQDADPLDLHRAFLAGALDTAAREVGPHHRQIRQGDGFEDRDRGVYIGSRASNRFMRIYDKALEQGLDGHKWTRIELVLGGDVSAAVSRFLTEDNFLTVVKGAIRGFCMAPEVKWYRDALEGEIVDLPKVPRRISDRKRWLLEQVLPSLKEELILSEAAGDWELYEAFQSVLEPYLHRERGGNA